MYVDIENLPNTARAWVFPCQRVLSTSEQSLIRNEMLPFLQTWQTHQLPLYASLYVDPYRVALFVDEISQSPSGCALDDWHNALRSVAEQIHVNCFYYEQILCQEATNWHLYTRETALQAWQQGQLKNTTLIANAQVSSKADFFSMKSLIPLSKSWLAKHYVTMP